MNAGGNPIVCLSDVKDTYRLQIAARHCEGSRRPGPAVIAACPNNSLLGNNAAERTGKDASRSQGRRQGSHRLILALKLMNAVNRESLEREKHAF